MVIDLTLASFLVLSMISLIFVVIFLGVGLFVSLESFFTLILLGVDFASDPDFSHSLSPVLIFVFILVLDFTLV